MSPGPIVMTALEHDTVRPLESLPTSLHARAHHHPLSHERLDIGRLLIGDRMGDRPGPLAPMADNVRRETEEGAPSAPATAAAPRDPAREALERTCLTVKRIAQDIGMPRATLEAYRLGTRRMPQSARLRLGAYLATHAAMLDELAQALIAPTAVTRE